MDQHRANTNKRILMGLAVAALLVAALGIWGMSQGPAGPAPKTTPTATPMTEAQARAEVRRLLDELDSFKSLIGFHDTGFSSKGPLTQPAQWRQDATALQQRISGDTSLPPLLRAAPGELLGLGLAYRNSKGQETGATRADRQTILDALR